MMECQAALIFPYFLDVELSGENIFTLPVAASHALLILSLIVPIAQILTILYIQLP
jgi:hypothetical protein